MSKPLMIAHRCGTDRYPEITLDSARFSAELGADYVEMDIRFTKDNIPVIAHDPDTGRLYGRDARICDLTAGEFTNLRNKQHPWHRAFTLEEALGEIRTPILFHIKESRIAEIMGYIDRLSDRRRIVMGVQLVEDAALLRAEYPGTEILAFMPGPEQAEAFAQVGSGIIRLWEAWVTPERVDQIHRLGCKVWVMAGISGCSTGYTSPERLLEWRALGVDGILLNEVDAAWRLLRA